LIAMSRLPIPLAVKRWLIPMWNTAHQVGWMVRENLGAMLSGRIETCSVCGRFRPMRYRRRIIPPRLSELWGLTPELADALVRKESSDCAHCGARLRCRRIASVLLELYPVGTPPAPAESLAAWAAHPETQSLRIAEINRIDGIHEVLAQHPNFASSDYFPNVDPGVFVNGTRSEDLTRLTYPDDSFDLVLTSESLEHVPDLNEALREIGRVLVRGGRHIFTIPMLPDVPTTFARCTQEADGSITHHAPRICHPGGDWGYPVFTEFGADLPDLLSSAGFDVDIHFGPISNQDLAQVYVCRTRPQSFA
jgi:SAM-dependent methyltransferase